MGNAGSCQVGGVPSSAVLARQQVLLTVWLSSSHGMWSPMWTCMSSSGLETGSSSCSPWPAPGPIASLMQAPASRHVRSHMPEHDALPACRVYAQHPISDTEPEAGSDTAASPLDPSDLEWAQRGRWNYVVGLVGKPSAGKSTFFNAVTGTRSGLACPCCAAVRLERMQA